MTRILPQTAPTWRVASLVDAPEIARLSLELGYPATEEQISARLAVVLDQPWHQVLVAQGPSGLLGWIAVERRLILESGEVAEIVGLVVDGAARRQGVGRQLVAGAESWARSQGLDRITVRSSTAREESHHFYAGLGYQRRKSQHVYGRALPAPPAA